jgi:ketosteroid isomerase-like protein
MRNFKRGFALVSAAALALSLNGCAKYGYRERHHEKADKSAIADAIKADEKSWNDQFQAKPRSLDALVGHYANDADFVAPGLKASGMANIRKAYDEALHDPKFNISFAADNVVVADSGDLAYSTGRFQESYSDPATKAVKSDSGTFLTVYRKQDDGSWKAAQDWAVADPVVPPPPK